MNFKRVIDVTREQREFLEKAFNVSNVMVWYALNFDEKRGNSDLAKRIRELALQRGGVVMNISPEIETIHTHDGMMRQYLPKDVMIEGDFRTGMVEVLKCGKSLKSWENPTLMELEKIQEWALGL